MTVERDIKRTQLRLKRVLKQVTRNRRLLLDIGEFTYRIIRIRSRAGFGLNSRITDKKRASRKPFKGLSQGWIDFRASSKKLNRSLTSPGKSNITFTGALLDSLKVLQTKVNPPEVTVGPSKKRHPKLRRGDKSRTMEEVAEHLEDGGRFFLGLTRREYLRVTKRYDNRFKDEFEKQFAKIQKRV